MQANASAGQPPENPQAASLSLRVGGIVFAAFLAALILLLPAPAELPSEGQRMAAIFLIALVLWATEAVHIAVTALLVIILQPVFQVEELRTAFSTFMSPVFFFVLAMFFIAEAFVRSGLDRRFALWLLSKVGTDSRHVVLAFMVGTASVSMIMSDVPACAIFMAIALGIFSQRRILPGSRFGKAIMMGIPIASLIGGVATPAGSSVNILGIYFIEEYGGVRVPFLHWMAIGIPMVVLLIPVAWWVLIRFCRPEIGPVGELEEIKQERLSLGGLRKQEKKVLIIVSLMLTLWIASTWAPQLDIVMIALAGAIVMCLPGIDLFTWKQVEKGVGWDSLLMIGSVTSLGAASVETGLAKWLVEITMAGIHELNVFWVVAIISAFTVVVHLIIPIGPVINAVLIPPVALLALSVGENPALYALPVAFTASCAFLLPLDAVPLITYSKGYYRMFDMLLPGSVISFFWVIWMSVLMVLLAPVLGFL